MRDDVFIRAVFFAESAGNHSKLGETKLMIKAQGGEITFYNGVELQNSKSQLFSLAFAVDNQRFPDMLATKPFFHRITGVTYMAAPAHIVGVQNIKPNNLAGIPVKGNSGKGLL